VNLIKNLINHLEIKRMIEFDGKRAINNDRFYQFKKINFWKLASQQEVMFDLKNLFAENHYCSDFDYWGLELDFDDYFDQFDIAVNLDHFTVAVESLYHSDSVARHYFDYFDFVGLLYRLNVVNFMEEFH
jgi:hypothetical protein